MEDQDCRVVGRGRREPFDPEEVMVGLDERAAGRRIRTEELHGKISKRELRPRLGQAIARACSEQPLGCRIDVIDSQLLVHQDNALGKLGQDSLGYLAPFLVRSLLRLCR